MGKIMVIANQKGGVGKSTTAVNLGACLASMDKRVLVIDIDPQGNATTGLGINKRDLKQCIYDVLINEVPIQEVVLPTVVEGLFIAPATERLVGAEIELVGMMSREQKMRVALMPVKDDYDYFLIDCPPSLGNLTINALTAADSVLIPIQCEFYALEGVSQLQRTIQLVQKYSNPGLKIQGVVMTMYDGRTKLSQQVIDNVKTFFPDRVYQSVIPRNVRLSEAPSHGLPITMYDGRSKGADAYMDLAKEVIKSA
ncbi:MAG: ParA family protein [Bacillota bacterium]|jgi:chromosome partitioning protein